MKTTDAQGFVTARATVVSFRPPTFPYAFDVSERDGGGRFVVAPDDVSKVRLYESYTVRFHPQDQFARVVAPTLAIQNEQKICELRQALGKHRYGHCDWCARQREESV